MAKTMLQTVKDGFKNLVANLGTERDKASGAGWVLDVFSMNDYDVLYRVSWMAGKIVDIPPNDATRRWRIWEHSDEDIIKQIEDAEAELGLAYKICRSMKQSRCFGGSAVYFAIKGQDPAEPFEPESVNQGDLEYLIVMPLDVLTAGDMDYDPLSPGYGKPAYYTVSGQDEQAEIHPSRLVVFHGKELLNPEYSQNQYDGWGDSVLLSAHEAVSNADATAANITSLVYEAKCDILQIPNLAEIMADEETRELLVQRVQLAAQLKGNNGMLMLDAEEEHSTKSYTFAGLPEINRQALQAVAGAADIPITRFLGQTPSGLSSTGESDLKNYYDNIASLQRGTMSPAMRNLDEALVRSTLGDFPDDLRYEWAPLWEKTDVEIADITDKLAGSVVKLAGTQLFPLDALAEASQTMLAQHTALPNMDISVFPDEEDIEPDPDAGGTAPETEEEVE